MREERGREPRRAGDGREPEAGSSAGVYLGLGLQFAVSILVFLYLGQWLDRRFGTEPWLLLISVFLGAGGSFYSIYRKLMADLRRQEERRPR
jgi:F0F1-type ATP synthase assembly protein I